MNNCLSYERYLDDLTLTLKNITFGRNDIVIALSRKGPRLLEYLAKYKDLVIPNVISEHALPFLFSRIIKNSESYHLYIFDDAIYYGSTISNLIDEINAYISAYDLHERVDIAGIYVAIKEPTSVELPNDINVYPIEPCSSGYGHYFVKRVMKDLRSLGRSLEIEFPAIRHHVSKVLKLDDLHQSFKNTYGDNNVCIINSTEGIPSLSVVWSKPDETTFRKMRLYIDDNDLVIVPIAPELFHNDMSRLSYVSFGRNDLISSLWRKIVDELTEVYEGDANSNVILRRNICRTGVVLLNYFSSIDTYIYESPKVRSCVESLGVSLSEPTLDPDNLKYLLYDNYVSDVVSIWNKMLTLDDYITMPIQVNLSKSDEIVYESTSLSSAEVEPLVKVNILSVMGSRSFEEALSVMSFNQTIMIERFSRYIRSNKHERLRFGYSFAGLWNFIRNNANKVSSDDITLSRLHKWVDCQIDNGSLVPQYIVDKNTSMWTRVFRPGENEDVMLSHIGRFVAFVIDKMHRPDIDGSDYGVLKSNLDGILSIVYSKYHERINDEEPQWPDMVDKKSQLVFSSTNENLVDFLIRMSVLTNTITHTIKINERLNNYEFSHNTTFSKELEDEIGLTVEEIVNKLPENKKQTLYRYPITINLFRSPYFDYSDIEKSIAYIVNRIEEEIGIIRLNLSNSDIVNEKILSLIDDYNNNLLCYELSNDALTGKLQTGIPEDKVEILIRVRRTTYVINCLISLFVRNIDFIDISLKKIAEDVKNFLHLSRLSQYESRINELSSETDKKTVTLELLEEYISTEIIK